MFPRSRLALFLIPCLASIFALYAYLNSPVEKRIGKISVGGKCISVFMAESQREKAQGLMFVESLEKDSGMFFVFSKPEILKFWMKNTLINLSIAFIDANGEIVDIQEMKAPGKDQDPGRYVSRVLAQFALEMSEGWFDRNGIKIGDRLSLSCY